MYVHSFSIALSLHILTSKLAGCTLFITGASRGIGKAIALRAAQDGANIVIAAKTTEPHPKLPGTIYTAAKEGTWSIGSLAKLCQWGRDIRSWLDCLLSHMLQQVDCQYS